MELPEDKRHAIRDAIFAGRNIEAIKLVRQVAGCGLKEAKDFVDAYSADLRRQDPAKFTAAPARRGCAGLVVLGLLLGLVLVLSAIAGFGALGSAVGRWAFAM